MGAGIKVTQREFEGEFAARVRMLNRMGYELRKMKSTADRLTVAGMVALAPGGRATPWTEAEATAFKALLDGLVGYFDGFTSGDGGDAQAALDAASGFGF